MFALYCTMKSSYWDNFKNENKKKRDFYQSFYLWDESDL